MASLTEKLNWILKSELYKKIQQTINNEFHFSAYCLNCDIEDDEVFEIKPGTYLNNLLHIIYIKDKAVSLNKKNKIYAKRFNIHYYKTISYYRDILENGMTCIKFLCKLYRELLIYEALLLQQGHTNIGLSEDIYEIVRCMIFYRQNYLDEILKFENNFLIKLAINIEKYLNSGIYLIDAANETRINGFVPFNKCYYQIEKNLDMYYIKATDEWIITNDDSEAHVSEGFDINTDY